MAGNLASPSGGRYATMGRSSSVSANNSPRSRNNLIIINEIVPGGCVDQDGRIKAGDRLLFVNDKKLSRASIGEAANALTSAPLGYTMIGVSKMYLVPVSMPPLPFSFSSPQFTAVVNSNPDGSLTLQVKHPIHFIYSTWRDNVFYLIKLTNFFLFAQSPLFDN